jgi:hypothetical protein
MSEIVDFIKENYVPIAIIVSFIFALLIIISIREWDLNPPKPDSKLVQQVVVEGMKDRKIILYGETAGFTMPNETGTTSNNFELSPSDSFCESHLGNSAKLESSCSELTQENCSKTNCCVWLESGSKGKCAAGYKDGPTYKKDKNGELITMDAYYYQAQRFAAPTSM